MTTLGGALVATLHDQGENHQKSDNAHAKHRHETAEQSTRCISDPELIERKFKASLCRCHIWTPTGKHSMHCNLNRFFSLRSLRLCGANCVVTAQKDAHR